MDDKVRPHEGQELGTGKSVSSGCSTQQDLSATQVAATVAPQAKDLRKIHYIILGGLAILVLVLIGASAMIFGRASNDGNEVSVGSDDAAMIDHVDREESATSVAFRNLTKAEAVAFLQSREDNPDGILPAGYVGKEITDSVIMSGRNLVVSDLDLIYSYGDLAELEQMAYQEYNPRLWFDEEVEVERDFEMKEYDYYAIVTPNHLSKETASCDHGYNNNCDSLLSFKRSYLDHLMEETAPHSFNERLYMNTRDPEIVNELLRVYTFFVSIGFGGRGNIYSYVFEEQDDRFVLTVNYITVGFNIELMKNPDSYNDAMEVYAINLFARSYAADKSDGSVYVVPVQTEPEVEYSNYIKSLPITQEEMRSLLGED